MQIYFDLEHILEQDYPININEIFNKHEKILTSQDMLDLAWIITFDYYSKDPDYKHLKTTFNLENQSFKNQFLTELLLQLFNTLSIYNSEHIFGVDNFLEKTHFFKSQKQLIYQNKNTFNSFVEHLRFCHPERLIYMINASTPEKPDYSIPVYPLAKSDFILENTPLSDFIFTHLINKKNPINNQIPPTKSNKENAKTKYIFNEEGKYFLSVLLLACASKNIPYTIKTIHGISLSSINNMLDTFYHAYHQEELINNPLEAFLFFINTECIFQPSLLNKIFLTFSQCFNSSKDTAMPVFILSLAFIPLLVKYPINVLKIYTWDIFFRKISDISTNNPQNILNCLIKSMNDMNNIINCFIYILIHITALSSNCSDSSILPILKREIFTYLLETGKPNMQWSILSSSSKNYTPIPSIFNKYFDFYTLFEFYNSPMDSSNLDWTPKDQEYAMAWPGYNFYAKYIFEHSK